MNINGRNRCCLGLGTALIVLGLLSITCFPLLLHYILKRKFQLQAGTRPFQEWQKTRPLILDIYFFNWTNAEDIYDLNTKPKLVEVGPYRFKFVREKVNVRLNNENNTITYQNRMYYYYDENSPGNYSDVVTTFNMVAWAFAQQTKDSNIFIKQSARFALLFSKLQVTKTVRELLFEGYQDPLIMTATSLSLLTSENVPNRAGFFYGRNESVGLDGVQNVHVNLDEKYGVLKNWNYKDTNPFYKGHCAEIQVSAGELYPRNMQPTHLTYFATDLCRKMQFGFERHHTVKDISTYKYSAGKEILDNGTLLEENRCYCQGKCVPSGVIDVSACNKGLQVFVSLPHFYNGDQAYVNAVEGLHPDKNKHEFYFALEPNLGIISESAVRMQTNLLVRPVPGFGLFEDIPEMMFPLFWTENKVELLDEDAANIALLLNIQKIHKIISISAIVLGSICMGLVLFFEWFSNKRKVTKRKLRKEQIPLARTACGNLAHCGITKTANVNTNDFILLRSTQYEFLPIN